MAQIITHEQMARLAAGAPGLDASHSRWLADGSAVLRVSVSDSAKPITFATGEPPDGEEPLVLRAHMTPKAMLDRLNGGEASAPTEPESLLDQVARKLGWGG